MVMRYPVVACAAAGFVKKASRDRGTEASRKRQENREWMELHADKKKRERVWLDAVLLLLVFVGVLRGEVLVSDDNLRVSWHGRQALPSSRKAGTPGAAKRDWVIMWLIGVVWKRRRNALGG